MTEPPLERLNYYNGRRLDAADLRLEQEYHIRVRRWLNKALVGSGIAMGLEVRHEPDTLTVVVSPGVAIDHEGREMIVLGERRFQVVGRGSARDGEVLGNYLTIAYREHSDAEEQGGCAPGRGERATWSGPARIVAEPELAWTDALPHERSGRIVLAQVELDANCTTVRRVHDEVRRYVGPASAARVRQYALEGFRDVDEGEENAQTVRFHVRGRTPTSVALYLRAEQFPSYYYTEMGRHSHKTDINTKSAGAGELAGHTHSISGDTRAGTVHRHGIQSFTGKVDDLLWGPLAPPLFGFDSAPFVAIPTFVRQRGLLLSPYLFTSADRVTARFNTDLTKPPTEIKPRKYDTYDMTSIFSLTLQDGPHTHPFGPAGITVGNGTGGGDHGHSIELPVQESGITSSPPLPRLQRNIARSGDPLSFVYGLRVLIDGKDQTDNILQQLRDSRPQQEDWSRLGDGASNHALAQKGSGAIKLDFLPNAAFGEGEHTITFELQPRLDGKRNGGRIVYNLYVE